MNFKQKAGELVNCFKGFKSFNFSNQLGQFTKSIPSIIGAAGATLMFIGVLIPFFTVSAGFYASSVHMIGTAFGWLVMILSLAMIGLCFLKQNFWSGLSAALCLLITVLTIIVCAGTANSALGGYGYYISSFISCYPSVGFYFLLLGELAVIAAFILEMFVFKAPAAAVQPEVPQYQPPQAPQYQQPQAPQYQPPQAPQYQQPEVPQDNETSQP